MRRKIVAANWKMNLHFPGAEMLVRQVLEGLPAERSSEVLFFPSFPYISMVAELLDEATDVYVGGQNCSDKEAGAFTGEVSASMLFDCGASHVLIGHSERRNLFGEQSEFLTNKLKAAHAAGLTPIWCCGEQKEERLESRHLEVVRKQMDAELIHLSPEELSNTIIAYEPIWAIGTGLNASSAEAQEMHAGIRHYLDEHFKGAGSLMPILYGGSCNESNAQDLFSCPDIDGGLIGGASLKAETFLRIIQALR